MRLSIMPLRALAMLVLVTAACSAADTSGAPSDARGPSQLVWLVGRSVEANDIPTALELSLVREDGSVAWSARIPMILGEPGGGIAFIAGPHDGRLAYGIMAGGATQIFLADAGQGTSREIATIDTAVRGAALGPSGGVLYLAVETPGLELHRLALEPRAAPERLAPIPPAGLDVSVTPFRGLRITPDGAHVLLERCDPDGACGWTEIATADGTVREIRAQGAGPLVDVSNDLLLALAVPCDAGPCPYVLVDRGSGASRPWDPGAHTVRLVVTPEGGELLAFDTTGVGGASSRIGIVDPVTLRERDLPGAEGGPGELSLAREGQDDWAPPGWLVLAPPGSNLGELGGPVLLNVQDGTTRRLPAPAGG